MDWNPERYLSFKEHRFQPFTDLAALFTQEPARDIVDLGCGTGELTSKLLERYPGSRVVGIDSSESMLDRARKHRGPTFHHGSIEDFAAGEFNSQAPSGNWDLIFSHAALHWVEDHGLVLPALWRRLNPGGRLAVQMPANHDHPVQRGVAELARREPYCTALGGFTRTSPVLGAREYAHLLFQLGGEHITALEKIYPHVLENAAAVVEWTRGTFLLPYLERLPDHLSDGFLRDFGDLVSDLLPGSPVFYGFRRVLFHAVKPAQSR